MFDVWKDQLDALIAQIRTEKYFEAHGIRTPLPAARVAVKEEAEFEFVDDEMAPWIESIESLVDCWLCLLCGQNRTQLETIPGSQAWG